MLETIVAGCANKGDAENNISAKIFFISISSNYMLIFETAPPPLIGRLVTNRILMKMRIYCKLKFCLFKKSCFFFTHK